MSRKPIKLKKKKRNDAEIEKALQKAIAHHQTGQLPEAEKLYRKIIKERPDNAEALHLLGVIQSQTGDHLSAIEMISKAIEINPADAQYHDNLGVVYKKLGDSVTAIEHHKRSIEIDPAYDMAHYNLGVSLQASGRVEEAAAQYAIVLRGNPDYADAHTNLAAALESLDRGEEAIAHYREAVRLNPDRATCHYNLGLSLFNQHHPEEAIEAYKRALALKPGKLKILYQLLRVYARIAAWEELDRTSEIVLEETRNQLHRGDDLTLDPFAAMGMPSMTLPLLHEICRSWAETYKRSVKTQRFSHPRSKVEKLRIGYMSADFSRHAVGMLLDDMFALHDRERFEIFAYSLKAHHDEYREKIEHAADHFIDLSILSDEEAAFRINSDKIQILVDLGGHTAWSRTEILAAGPAPIQAHMLGYPGTMGADFVHYNISSETNTPAMFTNHYTEKLLYLPETHFATTPYRMPEQAPSRSEYGLPEQAMVFCCLSGSYRITRKVFDSWMRILSRVPGSVLWLKQDCESLPYRLKNEAEVRGIDPDRLLFCDKRPMSLHWHQGLADLWLDTFILTAGTASYLCCWSGLPVLTLAGDTPHSRTGAAIVSSAGAPEMVVNSIEEYEDRAVYLAENPKELSDIGRKLIDLRETSLIFDQKRYLRHLEAGFIEMWELYLSDKTPRTIRIQKQ